MGNRQPRDRKVAEEEPADADREESEAHTTYNEEMNRLLDASRKGLFERFKFGSDFAEDRYDGKGCLVWFVALSDPSEDGTQEIGILTNGSPCSFLARLNGDGRPLQGWIAKARLLRFDKDMRIEADLVSDFDWPKRGSRIERCVQEESIEQEEDAMDDSLDE